MLKPANKIQHGTRNFLIFVNTTAFAYGQKIGQNPVILMVCNTSYVYKSQKITSTHVLYAYRVEEALPLICPEKFCP